MALDSVREAGELEVVGLLTTVNSEFDRVAMHGVRRALLQAQAGALGLPLHVVELPWPCSNEDYERLMGTAVARARGEGIDVMVFGDLYLQDVRGYRERALAGSGIEPQFPLWGQPTAELARQALRSGVKAIVACVDSAQVVEPIAGCWYDEALLARLPAGVDPCGENGEFHTVVVDGPGFRAPIAVRPGEVVVRDGFIFADVLLADQDGPPE